MSTYAGANWVADWLEVDKPNEKMSPFGIVVADILGELFLGIYHISKSVFRADWTNENRIQMTIRGSMSTFDFDVLTRLVFLAHHCAIRIEIEPASPEYIRLIFHRRQRAGHIYERHPSLDDAVAAFKAGVNLPEVTQ